MIKELLERYYYNLCSKEEQKEVEFWLGNLVTGSRDEYLLKEFLDELNIPVNKELAQSGFDKFEKALKTKHNKLERVVRKIGRWYNWAAAVFIIPILVAGAYFYSQREKPQEWVEEYAGYGQYKTVELPDNSKISLKAGSKIIYPKQFRNSKREVYVSGEAYAEIVKDTERPFILLAGEVKVEVLGTEFNIKSYIEDDFIAVSLIEGSVRMGMNYNGNLTHRILKPGEIVKFSKSTGRIKENTFLLSSGKKIYGGKGHYFMDESLAEIVNALERHFDIKIIIENNKLKEERFFSAFVNNESVDEILAALNFDKKMNITRRSEVIFIN